MPETPDIDDRARALAADPAHLRAARLAAWALARRFRLDRDEAESAAMLALWAAARGHRAAASPFPAYLRIRVRSAVIDAVRARSGRRPGSRPDRISLAEPIGDREVIADLLASDAPPAGALDDWAEEVRRLAAALPGPQRRVVLARYLDCRTAGRADLTARLLGIGPVRAAQLHGEAIAAFRRRLGVSR